MTTGMPFEDVVNAVFPALDAAHSVSVYKGVPPNTDPPYVFISAFNRTMEGSKTYAGHGVTVQIDHFTKTAGIDAVNALMKLTSQALTGATLTIANHDNKYREIGSSRIFNEGDGNETVQHGIVELELVLKET